MSAESNVSLAVFHRPPAECNSHSKEKGMKQRFLNFIVMRLTLKVEIFYYSP